MYIMCKHTHASKLLLCEEIVGVAWLAATCATSTLNNTSLTGPLGREVGDLREGERRGEGRGRREGGGKEGGRTIQIWSQ